MFCGVLVLSSTAVTVFAAMGVVEVEVLLVESGSAVVDAKVAVFARLPVAVDAKVPEMV